MQNRELQIMKMLDHHNVTVLLHFFHSDGEKPDEQYLNLVMDFVPETVHSVLRAHSQANKALPLATVKLYAYQLLRSLAYIHSLGICHRDIKPQNLLVDPYTHVVKLCDFGSAKILVRGEPNVAYICSRFYRAPELIFGATAYTVVIDVWSVGCVVAELLLGAPLFAGESGVDQLVEIIKVLGTPTLDEIQAMNPNYTEYKFPQVALACDRRRWPRVPHPARAPPPRRSHAQVKAYPWGKVFRAKTPPDAIDVVSRLLRYSPEVRLKPLEACAHPFFDELREEAFALPPPAVLPTMTTPAPAPGDSPPGRVPPLFDFKSQEIFEYPPAIRKKLVPEWFAAKRQST